MPVKDENELKAFVRAVLTADPPSTARKACHALSTAASPLLDAATACKAGCLQ